MPQSLSELGGLCDRAAEKLYDRPSDDDALADVATVVLLISSRLRRTVGPPETALPLGKATAASAMALISIDRRLSHLDALNADTADEARRVVDTALHLVARVLRILQSSPMPRSATSAI